MTFKKFNSTKTKFICIVLAFALLFSSAHIVAAELTKSVNIASAQAVDNTQSSSYINDLTTGSNEVFFPFYDTEVITNPNVGKPTVTTFGKQDADYYPSYTNQLTSANFDKDKKNAILAENQEMLEKTKEWFADGTLRENLQKHVSADGQFSNAAGNYNNAPRIEKKVTVDSKIAARKRSLGVFAPAGEVLTITIDERLVGKITVNIGYVYGDSDIGANKIDRWPNDRMARFMLEFKLTKTVTEIGSPLGGMVTINGVDSGLGNFDITVRGGIDMPSYKLGVSTKEDWQKTLQSPAPYVWLLTPYQYFVMPKVEIADIEDPYQAMMWWHKASMISMYSLAREDTGHFTTPIISIYDSYVGVGEAYASVWAFYTHSPKYWCHGMMDYDNLMSNGAWGAVHEYNHHHQSHAYASAEWGVGGIDEMTNNVINTLTYVLLTDIATTRSESNILGVWNGVSDPYCNYKLLDNVSKSKTTYESFDTSKLFGFADMIHTFGADKFIGFIRAQYGYSEVEGYSGQNLNQSNYLTTMDGFTLFASLYFKTDFVDYFTNVWHFNISQSIIDEIKSYGFDEYFSINNLYSSGIKGVETGRAYKINIGTTNVLKFDQYTLCSTSDYVLERVSEPSHGKLTKNSDGTYNYTPDNDFTEDNLELVYKVTLNGKIYYRTLVVKFIPNYNYIETVTYNVDSSKNGLSAEAAKAEFAKEENIVSSGTVNSFTTSTLNGNNIVTFKAKVVFPFTKQLKFMVYGDDKSWLRIDEQTAFTSTYIGNDSAGINHATNKIDVLVEAGKPLEFEAYCFNTGGAGNLRVKYSEDGGVTYQNIPSSYCFGYNVTEADIEKSKEKVTNIYPAYVDFRNLYLNKWYSDSINYTPSGAQCLDDAGNPVRTVNGADIRSLFDGNLSTTFHTAWQGKPTPYPHNYFFTFDEEPFINCIKFDFQPGYYAIGEYEIWASEDGENYEMLCAGVNTGSNFNVVFDKTVTSKHIKLVVKSNSQGQTFTNIREIEFTHSLDLQTDYNVYSSGNGLLSYEGSSWEDVQGNYVNNTGKHASTGTLKFYLTGTDLMLYSINEASTIKIDGVTYNIKANSKENSPSFIIDGMEFGKHLVEIQANNMTVDIIKTTGQISDLINLSTMQIDVVNQYYNGNALRPVLSCNGVALIEDVDYTVTSIKDNVNVGTATFKITGKGGNEGTFEGTFEILPVHLDNSNVSLGSIEDVVYTGKSITPNLTVTINVDGEEVVLKKGTDYTVVYQNNVEIGTATIIINFKGNYSGKATAHFNIVSQTQQNDPSKDPSGGGAQKPSSGGSTQQPSGNSGGGSGNKSDMKHWVYVGSVVGVIFMIVILLVVVLLARKKK